MFWSQHLPTGFEDQLPQRFRFLESSLAPIATSQVGNMSECARVVMSFQLNPDMDNEFLYRGRFIKAPLALVGGSQTGHGD